MRELGVAGAGNTERDGDKLSCPIKLVWMIHKERDI